MATIFETERLIIRQWEDDDYRDLYEYASDASVTRFLSFPTYLSLETAIERIAFVKEQYALGEMINDYCIELKEGKKVIGSIGIVKYKEKNFGEVEIGYILNPNFQGHGYMTESLVGFFKYIKRNQIAKRIVLRHDVDNVKSGNVMKRAGMTFEGVLRKAGSNNIHSRHDLAVYSILDEEIALD